MNSVARDKAFTQNWIQSLTLVAQDPVARSIKPLLDTISLLCGINVEGNPREAAERLWQFAEQNGIKDLLAIMPIQEPDWTFDRDDPFVYRRAGQSEISDFENWLGMLGLAEHDVSMTAEVTSKDWLNLVRQEAVRLQRSMNTAAVGPGMNLKLPCKGHWIDKGWSIRFDSADWIVNRYEEPITVERPDGRELVDKLGWMMTWADEQLLPKQVAKFTEDETPYPWLGCLTELESLHRSVLGSGSRGYSPWFRRTWGAVWPVVYREQGALKGLADIDVVRKELAACVSAVPKLTVWMFAFGKLIGESRLGHGLGLSADYSK
ncbi:MAG: hypothetical protein U0892_12625 [Pirellulales bacterium]